jgi:formamidopyrimidine-DNA glycosylase
MPELPEVEFARRSLLKWTRRHAIVRTEVDPKARTFRGAALEDVKALKGRIRSIERRGKYLMLAFEDGRGAIAHLGMTGKFLLRPEGAQMKWSRARFVLDSGAVIHFQDPRLFGRIEPLRSTDFSHNPAIAKLGIDPLLDGISSSQLRSALEHSKQDLKVALMDQQRIAGLGNIHAAEALFRAKVHPARKPASLTDEDWERLAQAITDGIRFALSVEDGDEIEYVEEPGAENPFLVYGKAGERCPVCGHRISTIDQGGRTTFFCPSCQPKRAHRERPQQLRARGRSKLKRTSAKSRP